MLPALAALAALAAFAAHQRDPQAAAETAFLALLATALLAAVAALEAAPGALAAAQAMGGGAVGAAAAVLVVLAAWTLPVGPLRGAAVAALLVGALAVVAGWRLTAAPGGAESDGSVVAAGAAPEGTLRQILAALPLVVPLALAVQVLVRSDRLLAPELGPRLLAGLLGLPLVAAVAIAFLMARAGRAPALTAAATAALVGPGFTTSTTGALVALAAAEAAWRPWGQDPAARRVRVAGGSAVAAAVVGVGLIEPWAAAVIALTAFLIGGRAIPTGAVALAALAGAIAPFTAGGWSGELTLAATTVSPLALVVALAATSRGARRWALAAGAAALLAAAAARIGGGLPLLAAPLAAVPLLAGRSLAARTAEERHALFAPQVVWSAALLAASVLAAAYPWLRPRPLASALGLFGLDGGWAAATVVAAVGAAVAVLGWRAADALHGRRGGYRGAAGVLGDREVATEPAVAIAGGAARVGASRLAGAVGDGAGGAASSASPPSSGVGAARRRARRQDRAASPSVAAALAAAAVSVALVAALPSPRSQVLIAEPRSLDAESSRLEIELPRRLAVGELVVVADTSLSHAVAVQAATPVASIFLVGESVAGAAAPLLPAVGAWTLVAGRDTAEWSIRRPDVVALAAHPAPEPWLARVAADAFFGLAFRSRGVLQAPGGARRLVVERHSALPPETVVHLHRLEVRR